MNNNFILQPNMGILLNFFSVRSSFLSDFPIQKLWEEMNDICKDGRSIYDTFYLFGAFDLLNVGISSDIKALDAMQKIKSYEQIKGVMDFFIHYGTIIHIFPKPFDFYQTVKKSPLIGITSIKIRLEIWREIYKIKKDIEGVKREVINLFTKALAKTIKKRPVDASDYNAIIILSYDCEDIIIIFLSKSYEFNKTFISNFRSLEFKDINQKFISRQIKHIVANSNTILGAHLQSTKRDLIVFPRVDNTHDKINWSTFIEVRPGHLRHAKNEISKLLDHKFIIEPTVGRNDLIVRPQDNQGVDLNNFFVTHSKFTKKLPPNKSIISLETYISFPNLRDIETNKRQEHLYPAVLSIEKEIHNLLKRIKCSKKIHKLEKESFSHIVRKLKYLLEDRYLQDSFITLSPIVFRGIQEYLKLNAKKRSATFGIWTGLLELCYATRYQGSPPIGETAVYPTLGFYSSGQKVLVLLDYLGNYIIKLITKKIGLKKFYPQYIATININCPSGTRITNDIIPTSFIFLPPRPIFHPESLMVIFLHELGHVIWDCFILSAAMRKEFKIAHNQAALTSSCEELADAVAEFISIKILSNLDFNTYKNIMKSCLKLFEAEGQQKIFLKKMKQTHIKEAMELSKLLSGPDNLERFCKTYKLNSSAGKLIYNFLSNIQELVDDEIVTKVRHFINSDDKLNELWNLWIPISLINGKCYVQFSQ